MHSHPTVFRKLFAIFLLAATFVYIVALKATRGSDITLAPEWLAGILPSLLCTAVLPFIILTSNRNLTYSHFLKWTVLIMMGFVVYEILHVVRTKQVFDWDHLVASFVGSGIAVLIGSWFFKPASKIKTLIPQVHS